MYVAAVDVAVARLMHVLARVGRTRSVGITGGGLTHGLALNALKLTRRTLTALTIGHPEHSSPRK